MSREQPGVSAAVSVFVSLLAIVWALWRLRRGFAAAVAGRPGQRVRNDPPLRRPHESYRRLGWLWLAAAVRSPAGDWRGWPEPAHSSAPADCAGRGSLAVLVGKSRLRRNRFGRACRDRDDLSDWRFATRPAIRAAARSTIGLVAAASFLLVAVSALSPGPTAFARRWLSGTGGSAGGRKRSADPGRSQFVRRPSRPGLFQPRRPHGGYGTRVCLPLAAGRRRQLLESLSGTTAARGGRQSRNDPARRICLVCHGGRDRCGAGKSLAAVGTETAGLSRRARGRLSVVPVIMDEATAMYSLHIGFEPSTPSTMAAATNCACKSSGCWPTAFCKACW